MNDKVVNPLNAADQNATVLNIGGAAAAAAPPAGAIGSQAASGKALGGSADFATQLFDRIKALNNIQKAILAGSVLLVFALIFGLTYSSTKSDYKVLFSNVNERDSAAIVASLQQMNIPYKFTEGGGAIMVPAKSVYETRLQLAGQGLPKSGFVGFEVLENQRLGTSQFVEQVNYQRALEGELARSISSLSSVQTARVHLAVPKQSAFMREQQRPTASVVVTLHPGRFLDQRQAVAISHLVGSSVPGMGPKDVTILDADGSMLAPSPDRAAGLDSSQMKYVQELEAAFARRVAAILEPIAGRDNVKAQVTLDMDFDELARTQELFGKNTPPNPGSIRSQQSIRAQGTNVAPGGIPGALTNQPPPNPQAPIQTPPATGPNANAPRLLNAPGDAAGGVSGSFRDEQTTNYEVDRTIEYLRRAKGEVRRVSAAVVVNYKNQTDPRTGETRQVPFTPQELTQIAALARDAVGFRQDRGDSVSVANIPFTPEPTEDTAFYKDPATVALLTELLKYGLILGLLAALFFGVIRPILFPPKPKAALMTTLEEEMDEKLKAELALLSPENRERRRVEIELQRQKQQFEEQERRRKLEDERRAIEEERRLRADAMQQEYDDLVRHAKEFMRQDPRLVASVFKGWIAQAKAKGE